MEIAPHKRPSRRAGGEVCKKMSPKSNDKPARSRHFALPLPAKALADWLQALCNAISTRAASNGNADRKNVGRMGVTCGSWSVLWAGFIGDWLLGALAVVLAASWILISLTSKSPCALRCFQFHEELKLESIFFEVLRSKQSFTYPFISKAPPELVGFF